MVGNQTNNPGGPEGDRSKEALLCLDVIREFGGRPTPTSVDRPALKRAAGRLARADLSSLTEERAQEVPTALAKAKSLLGEK